MLEFIHFVYTKMKNFCYNFLKAIQCCWQWNSDPIQRQIKSVNSFMLSNKKQWTTKHHHANTTLSWWLEGKQTWVQSIPEGKGRSNGSDKKNFW